MKLSQIDPLHDSRWRSFIDHHPQASVFHSPEWLKCLRRTYGYHPLVFTSTAADCPLENGVLFCKVESWLTGRRLVSVPFSDHCDILADRSESVVPLLKALADYPEAAAVKYTEIRPLEPLNVNESASTLFRECNRYYFHRIDLRPGPSSLYAQFHASCIQRKIRKADREKLEYRTGRSEDLNKDFYGLLLQTRRRHGLAPQPFLWFKNLAECLGETMQIRMAYHGAKAVAAIITLMDKNRIIYKYGCSDEQYSHLGGTQMLLWRAIQDGCQKGLAELDLGRTNLNNSSLAVFKERWGATRLYIQYWRSPFTNRSVESIQSRIFEILAKRMPLCVLRAAGTMLYRHVG
jgi:CelD/BcsL family acetyltransferase involved in cellulose biosynthesis